MCDERETRQRCDTCDRIIIWNAVIRCEKLRIKEISNNENEENEEIVNVTEGTSGENRASEGRISERQRFGEIKVKGKIKKQNKGIARVFLVN